MGSINLPTDDSIFKNLFMFLHSFWTLQFNFSGSFHYFSRKLELFVARSEKCSCTDVGIKKNCAHHLLLYPCALNNAIFMTNKNYCIVNIGRNLLVASGTQKFVRFKFNILWRACRRRADTETHSSGAHREFIVFLRKFSPYISTSPLIPLKELSWTLIVGPIKKMSELHPFVNGVFVVRFVKVLCALTTFNWR